MTSISLHPEKGVNPKMTCCPQCGERSDTLVLLGNKDYVTECPSCQLRLIGGGACPRCSNTEGRGKIYGVNRQDLDKVFPGNTLPGEICESCQEKNEAVREMVAAGGVHWKCDDCGSAGAIKAEHPLAKAVREQMGIEPPKPCGIAFNKKEGCPVCSEEAVNQEETLDKKTENEQGGAP